MQGGVPQRVSMLKRPPPFFVGDHLALDFLNTLATPKDAPVEWLRDGRDLVDWLEQAKVIAADVAGRFRPSKDQRALDGVAGRAREFRGWLHGFITRHMGKPPDDPVVVHGTWIVLACRLLRRRQSPVAAAGRARGKR